MPPSGDTHRSKKTNKLSCKLSDSNAEPWLCTVQKHCVIAAQGHCWVEGDNPDTSTDSRSRYGAVWRPPLATTLDTVLLLKV